MLSGNGAFVRVTGSIHHAPARRWWQRTRRPATLGDITPEMLAPIQRIAERTKLPQEIWPSRFYGADFVGTDTLLVSGAMPVKPPADAAPGSAPLLTLLPRTYWEGCDEANPSPTAT
ncbi:hypothetical protein ACW9HR_22355 [Nocardia gipuzkoensis]